MLLIPETSHIYHRPGGISQDWLAKFLDRPVTLPAVHLHKLNNTYVHPFGPILDGWGRVWQPSVYPMIARLSGTASYTRSFWKARLTGKVVRVKGPALVAHHAYASNYYHFVTEVVPRLYLLRMQQAVGTLLLSAELKRPFYEQYLKALGFDDIIWMQSGYLYQVSELVLVDWVNPFAYHHPAVLPPMAKWLKEKMADKLVKGPERIYVSRQKAPKRKALNNDAFEAYLQSKGFVTVYLEDLDLYQQVSLFASANLIVGIHGAGWTNMLFMKPGARLLNLIHKEHEDYAFYTFIDLFGIEVIHLPCEGDGTDIYMGHQSITVDLEALDRYL